MNLLAILRFFQFYPRFTGLEVTSTGIRSYYTFNSILDLQREGLVIGIDVFDFQFYPRFTPGQAGRRERRGPFNSILDLPEPT